MIVGDDVWTCEACRVVKGFPCSPSKGLRRISDTISVGLKTRQGASRTLHCTSWMTFKRLCTTTNSQGTC